MLDHFRIIEWPKLISDALPDSVQSRQFHKISKQLFLIPSVEVKQHLE